METIDKQFLDTPWYGSRQMARYMQRQGHKCGRHRVRRLMRLMRLGVESGRGRNSIIRNYDAIMRHPQLFVIGSRFDRQSALKPRTVQPDH